MTHFVQRIGSHEVNLFQQLVPAVLVKIEQIAAADQEKAVIAIDIFNELIGSEVSIVVPHIKPVAGGAGAVGRGAPEPAVPHYSTILANISKLLGHESCPRVVDQIVGAIARFLIVNLVKVPPEELVPAVLPHLPLKEDFEEYELA